jgi:hypothetical protein
MNTILSSGSAGQAAALAAAEANGEGAVAEAWAKANTQAVSATDATHSGAAALGYAYWWAEAHAAASNATSYGYALAAAVENVSSHVLSAAETLINFSGNDKAGSYTGGSPSQTGAPASASGEATANAHAWAVSDTTVDLTAANINAFNIHFDTSGANPDVTYSVELVNDATHSVLTDWTINGDWGIPSGGNVAPTTTDWIGNLNAHSLNLNLGAGDYDVIITAENEVNATGLAAGATHAAFDILA